MVKHMNRALSTFQPFTSNSDSGEPELKIALAALPYEEGPQRIMPLGLQNISAYIKKNIKQKKSIKIFDYSNLESSNTEQLEDLISWKPDLIGISIYSSHVCAAIHWGHTIQQSLPASFIFCGGPHISLAAEDFLIRSHPTFKLAIQGEGEHPTRILIEHFNTLPSLKNSIDYDNWAEQIPNTVWINSKGKIKHSLDKKLQLPASEWENPLMEYHSERLQNLYFTDRRDKKKRTAIALTSSRGCPLSCSFCAIVAADKEGPKWRAVEAETLVAWIGEALNSYDFQHIYIMDANFFVKKERVLAFSRGLHKLRGGTLTWSSSSTVGYLLKIRHELPTLVLQGLRLVEMGIEAGSQSQLDYMNKRVSVQNNIDAIKALQKNNIDIGLDFIMFYHDQKKQEIIDNLIFLVSAGVTEHESFDHYFNIMMLYPGTPVRHNLENSIGEKLSLEKLPFSRDFIDNYDVKKIYSTFIDDFAKPWVGKLEAAISSNLRVLSQSKSKSLKAQLSLMNIYLRHMPFIVLWELSHAKKHAPIEVIVPQFSNYTHLIESLLHRKDEATIARKIVEIGTTGVGGHSGELISKIS